MLMAVILGAYRDFTHYISSHVWRRVWRFRIEREGLRSLLKL